MKLTSLLVIAVAASACAHAQPLRERWTGRAGDREVEILVVHAPEDAAVAAQLRTVLPGAAALAGRWGALPSPLVVTVHPSHAALETAARRPGHPWLRAWARPAGIELQSPRTWSRGAATDAELTQLLAHELTHCAMFVAVGGDGPAARSIPVWFREGLATWTSGERFEGRGGPPARVGTLRTTAYAYRTDALRVYAAADRAFRALVEVYGAERIRALLAAMRAGAPFDEAFREATGVPAEEFEALIGPALGASEDG